MRSDRVLGGFFLTTLILLGFLINEERNMDVDTREVIEHLVKANDELQELVVKGMDVDQSLAFRLQIVGIIKELNEVKF